LFGVVEATDLRGDTMLFMELHKVRATMFVQILQKTGRITKYCKKLTVMTSDMYNVDGMNLFLSIQPRKTLIFRGNFCHGGIVSEQ
jgi:hypothetical protein